MFKNVLLVIIIFCTSFVKSEEGIFKPSADPLVRVVDLNIGEVAKVQLANGKSVSVELLKVIEHRCELRDALRKADVTCKVDGKEITLVCATYNLPRAVGELQIDCPVVRGYISGSSKKNVWSLEKDARLRLWPEGSSWIKPGTFCYPVKQRWFASDTQMANDPCFVNACDTPEDTKVYYHYGLDFGGAEGLVDVVAATAGTVISKGDKIIPGGHPTQVKPRYDVVYIRDARGWYYRYSHLHEIDAAVHLGKPIKMRDRIGSIGKEGASGGWTHLHFDINTPQPSGHYGMTDGYAFIFQAYRDEFKPDIIAVARPHLVAWAGQNVLLDGTRSWHSGGVDKIKSYTWILSSGETEKGSTVKCSYEKPGHYTEILTIVDEQGRTSHDFAVVQVFDKMNPKSMPPSIHVAYWPTTGIKAGDEITFKVRTFGVKPDQGEETWNFGDATSPCKTRSDGNASARAKDGYAVIKHRFEKPGKYFVSASRKNDRGEIATGRVLVDIRK